MRSAPSYLGVPGAAQYLDGETRQYLLHLELHLSFSLARCSIPAALIVTVTPRSSVSSQAIPQGRGWGRESGPAEIHR